RMIGEAVHEMKGDGPAERAEVRVELPVDAHIPHDYVAGERLRLEAYTAIAAIDSEADIKAVTEELTDRYGTPPRAVMNLLEVARLRAKARRAGLTDITQQGNHIRFAPVELPESRQVRAQRMYPRTLLKPAVRTMLVPVPKAGAYRPGSRDGGGSGRAGAVTPIGAPPLRDAGLLAWCEELVEAIFGDGQASAGTGQGGSWVAGVRRRVVVRGTRTAPGGRKSKRAAVRWPAAAAVAAAGALTIAGCGQTQLGAAALYSNQRISTAKLTAEVANLNTYYQAD